MELTISSLLVIVFDDAPVNSVDRIAGVNNATTAVG